jgi:hypothetical protein
MNKIVLEHFPVSKLPEELRGDLSLEASVTVTIEEEVAPATSREDFLKLIRDAQARSKGVTMEEAVARIRELRDEWDD